MELVVWAGGRWRRVCAASGRVCGWRRQARLVEARGGALTQLPRAALKAVRRGPRLPRLRTADNKPRFKVPLGRPAAPDHRYKCDASVQTDSEPVRGRPAGAAGLADKENAGQPRHARSIRSVSTEILELRNPNRQPGPDQQENGPGRLQNGPGRLQNGPERLQNGPERLQNGPVQSMEAKPPPLQCIEHPFLKGNKCCNVTSQQSHSQHTLDEFPVKELIIDEEDVLLLRNYIVRNKTNIDIDRFDRDDGYKTRVFFKINPLVRVRRSEHIDNMLRDPDNKQATLQFARQLGLRSTADSDSDIARDMARDKRPRRTRAASRRLVPGDDGHHTGTRATNKNATEVSDSDESDMFTLERYRRRGSDEENRRPRGQPGAEARGTRNTASLPAKRAVFVARKPPRPGREYSSLEDHAIVSWLSAAPDRERAVNGNRVWRDLQGTYTSLTGQTRSWHSLRNRYLRYILPALGALALPPHQQRRLRAHAAIGSIKHRRRQSRRNSALYVPPVRSAHARRPRSPAPTSPAAHTRSSSPSPVRRELRSSLRRPGSPKAPGSPHEPPGSPRAAPPRPSSPQSNSELKRRFALRHRSTPQDSPSITATQPGGVSPRPAPKRRRLYNPAA